MEDRMHSSSQPSATGAAYGKDNGHAGPSSSRDDAFTKTSADAETAVSDIQSLRADLNSLRESLADFITHAGSEAVRSARNATGDFAGQVSGVAASVAGQVSGIAGKGAEMAAAASNQAKTIASEIEGIARRNPIGALAGALLIGVLIGLAGRKRS